MQQERRLCELCSELLVQTRGHLTLMFMLSF